jgi:inorganic triphosphatase YgiF
MQETELKFQVPAARSAAVRRAVGTASARTTPLRAVYFDTPELHLARAHMALRLRLEASTWVQTLKGRGDGMMQRLEHEVRLPAQHGTPELDLQRHAGTAAATALQAALPAGAALRPLYTTDIQRLHRCVRCEGAVIEIAHDVGALLAGGRQAEVDEVEFELISGPPAALPALALRWVARHGLWWDCRSKSERGTRLALQQAQAPAVEGDDAGTPADTAAPGAWNLALQASLARVLPNAAELAGALGTAEHLLQLRRALHRLQAVLGRPGDSAAALLAADWRRLADALDAGAPHATAATVTGKDFNTQLLRTLALSLTPG